MDGAMVRTFAASAAGAGGFGARAGRAAGRAVPGRGWSRGPAELGGPGSVPFPAGGPPCAVGRTPGSERGRGWAGARGSTWAPAEDLEPAAGLGREGCVGKKLSFSEFVTGWNLFSSGGSVKVAGSGGSGGMTVVDDQRRERALHSARARVLEDLATCDIDDPAIVSLVEDAVAHRRWWVEQWPEGVAYVAGLVAQDVQDALLERYGRWPLCPLCDARDPHALDVAPELGPDPHWVCPVTSTVVAPVGRLWVRR